MNPWITHKLIYPLYEQIAGRDILSKWRELEKTQWLSVQEIQQLQWDKLRAILKHAYQNVPFYQRHFNQAGVKPDEIQNPADKIRIPPLTKRELQQQREEIIAMNSDRRQLHKNATGGSTGEPTIFYQDQLELDYQSAVTLRGYRWAGLEPGQKHLMVWGSAFDLTMFSSLKGQLANLALNRHILPAFELTLSNLSDHIETIQRLRPRLITGYASALNVLARYIIDNQFQFRVWDLKSIVSSAETLFPIQRKAIEEAFGCPVYNRYGSREFGAIAHECSERSLHINAENVYVEILQQDHLTNKDKLGEFAITTLNNYGFPFIRYLIGDAGAVSDEKCLCGRGLPLIEKLLGRVHDILITPDGRLIPGEFFPHLFKEVTGVERFQVIQEGVSRIIFRIQTNQYYSPNDSVYLQEKTQQVVGEQTQIDFEFVDEIPTSPSGKFRFTISEVPIDFSKRT